MDNKGRHAYQMQVPSMHISRCAYMRTLHALCVCMGHLFLLYTALYSPVCNFIMYA